MKFLVTPLAMSEEIFLKDPMASFARPDSHTVQAISDYENRPETEVEADEILAACEKVWTMFQNIDEDHLCPDDGRSLMVGDMLKVTDEDDKTSYWICCSFGWTQTLKPTNEAVRVEVKPN